MGRRIERNVVERAYSICKRYEKLSERFNCHHANDTEKWIELQHKKSEMTRNALERNMQYCDARVVQYMVEAVIKNRRPKDALMDALHLIGYELY